jgi:PAS domain S-box-containing protein
MKPLAPSKPADSPVAAGLRRQAESALRRRRKQGALALAADQHRLVQELQVHQIELEMQNTELEKARDEREALLEKYTDLYDSAPAGYFSVDEAGQILAVNLTGAGLLGVARSRLLGQRLQRFVIPSNRSLFHAFLAEIALHPGKRVCEMPMLTTVGTQFWASLTASFGLAARGEPRTGRIAITDVTLLKRAVEAQSRLKALAVSNRKLEAEVDQRRAAEESLRISEMHLGESLAQSRRLAHRILSAHEEERKRISRELHDQVVQTLTGINLILATLKANDALDPRHLAKRIERARRLVEKSVNIVHRFARELRPAVLDDMGLVAALHAFFKEFRKRSGILVTFTTVAPAKLESLSSEKSAVLYRIAQSALNNSAQHAQPSRVDISLKISGDTLHLEIKDDGRGFAVERVLLAKRHKRLGLPIMKERVEMVGGTFAIESAPGRGATIRAEVPFVSDEAAI